VTGGPEQGLIAALTALQRALTAVGASHMLIGGLAVISPRSVGARPGPRLTLGREAHGGTWTLRVVNT
jgi:hypothetical protein